MMVNGADAAWLQDTLQKTIKKLAWATREIGAGIPASAQGGRWDDKSLPGAWREDDGIAWWTNGFYPGILWLLYRETGDSFYKDTAVLVEEKLDRAFHEFTGLHHDVGFMWLPSSVADYKITGDKQARRRGLHAATLLAGRFNHKGGFIRAWNHQPGWAIIDCMMNVQLLHWAAAETGDTRFSDIAVLHADKALAHFIRPDGSVKHIVSFDMETGEELEEFGGQGYGVGSAWSRGQGWALYGFVLSYIHTGKVRYLDAAKRVAHYFISCVREDYVPNADFRAPAEPVIKDTSAGALAACALIELAKAVPELERGLYFSAAVKLLQALTAEYADFSDRQQPILNEGSGAYHDGNHINLIYADFYYLEALLKLKGDDILLW